MGNCPRCGNALRFSDEDGQEECTCGWSERSADTEEDPTSDTLPAAQGSADDPDEGGALAALVPPR